MKLRITNLIMVAAIVALLLVAGSTAAWAQNCPTSPYYSPDFTSNQSCLTLNGNASFPTPAGSAAAITSWSATGGTVTFQATNSFTAGEPITLSGFTTSTFFNGLTFPVLRTGLSGSQFEIAFSGFSGSSDTGTATPLNVLQLTPNQTHQVGSAWYNTQQPVAAAFSTTFTFQLSNSSLLPADGIAFVIQNSAQNALGPDGCGVGFGFSSSGCTTGLGIPDSLAVEFNTYLNLGVDKNSNNVSIQSNGTNNNCVDASCTLPGGLNYHLPVTLADGNIHTVTISYTLQSTPTETSCVVGGAPGPCLDVILDGNDLFPAGVPVNLAALLTLNSGTAWVGFTGSTGAQFTKQVIPSWTFTPQAQSQSGTVTTAAPTVFNANGGFVLNSPTSGYDLAAQLTSGSSTTVLVTEIPFASQNDCNAILAASPFNSAQCFVIVNGAGTNANAAVGFEVTCPASATGGTCGSDALPSFLATLGTDFYFNVFPNESNDNPGLATIGTSPNETLQYNGGSPLVGFLKFDGPDPLHPCTLNPDNYPPVILSNQISSFNFIDGGTGSQPVKGKAAGTGSCWLATYNTPFEAPTITSFTAPVNGGIYQQNQQDSTTLANYTCNAVNNGNAVTGPYLTVTSCSATDTPGGSVSSGTQFDTTTLGTHTFTATVVDSALNSTSSTVTYDVQASQMITLTNIPANAAYGSSFTVGATGGASPNPVTFTSYGSCSNSGATYTMTSGTGTCSVIANQTGDTNYSAAPQLTQTVNASTAALTITASSATVAYGAAVSTPTAGYSGFVNGDSSASLTTQPTCSVTALPAGNPVGTYATNCTGAVDSNYTISYTPGTLTITAVPLTITASSGAMTYGGTPPAITASYSGFVGTDTAASLTAQPGCSTTATSSSAVGSYPSSCTGAVDANYTISYSPGTVTVGQAALVITASSAAMTYGGTVPTITAGYSGIVNSHNPTTAPTCSTTATTTSSPGSYPTTCTGAADADYTITYVSGTVTVGAAPLTITASSGSMIYGGTPPAITASYSGILNGHNPSTPPSCSTSATGTSPVGSYPSSCTGAADADYTISYVSGTVTVTQAGQTITFGPLSNQVLGAAPFAVSATASSGLAVSFNSQTTGVCTVSGNIVTLGAVGTCTIQATQGGNTNYAAATPVNQSFQVTAPPTVTISPANWSFGTLYLGQSARQTFTLTNPGTSSVTISSISIPGNKIENPQPAGDPDDFQITSSNCSKTLAAGASCKVTVTFVSDSDDPGLPNGDYAYLTVADNATGSPQTAYMSGAVINPRVSLSSTILSFGKQTAGTTSAAKKVTLTNSGTSTLQLTGLAISGNFALASGTTCTSSTTLSPGGNCLIYVTFTPATKGTTYTGGVIITDNAQNSPQGILLTGTGN